MHTCACPGCAHSSLLCTHCHCRCCHTTSYDFGKILGKGQFGTTRLVTDKKTGEQLACKSIGKRKLTTAEDIADVQREVQILHHLAGHQHVVSMRGAFEDKHHVHIGGGGRHTGLQQ